jgi:hypothetical protein
MTALTYPRNHVKAQTLLSVIVISARTTPAEALEMAYLCGFELTVRGAKAIDFPNEFSSRINMPHVRSPLLPFLRVGFAAGYFKHAMPDARRVADRYAAEKRDLSKLNDANSGAKARMDWVATHAN